MSMAERLHGMEGLRIVDASIMPDLVRAPINPTVLMIGERIADIIRQRRFFAPKAKLLGPIGDTIGE